MPMKFEEMFETVKKLPFDTKHNVVNVDGVTLWIYRPSKPPVRFKNYDPEKNFQIWLSEGEREFKPNHLRVFIDLNLRVRSRPDLKQQLMLAFDNIFKKNEVGESITIIQNEKFTHFLNPIEITANLSQLFILEQLWGYHKPSKYDPASLFYQGWVRQCLDNTKEIDNLIMSIANRQPPMSKYTSQEDKNHSKFNPNSKPLWYLD